MPLEHGVTAAFMHKVELSPVMALPILGINPRSPKRFESPESWGLSQSRIPSRFSPFFTGQACCGFTRSYPWDRDRPALDSIRRNPGHKR